MLDGPLPMVVATEHLAVADMLGSWKWLGLQVRDCANQELWWQRAAAAAEEALSQ